MNNNKYLLFGCIFLPVVIVVAFIIGFVSTFGNRTFSTPKVPSDAWLRLNPSALVNDYNEMEQMRFFGSVNASSQDICDKVRAAAKDDRIKGMLIEPNFIQINYPALNEIGYAIQDFKKAGKPVVAFGDYLTQGDYLLCSYADQIYMEPSASAGLLLEGVSAHLMFYKDMLDKLGIKMHILQSGAYKGAGEPYSQTQLSPGTRDNIDKALLERYRILKTAVAERRKLDLSEVTRFFEERDDFFVSAAKAKEWKLIDFPMGRDAMLEKLKLDDDKLLDLADYHPSPAKKSGDKVAVVYLTGEISPDTGTEFGGQGMISAAKVKKIINSIKDDKNIKAVVLRINSPGGSALESELIYQQLFRLKKDYPIVVSMGGVAASGGYYISCSADYLMASEATITGSIGVIGMIPETVGLGKKLGLNTQTLKHGKFAGAFNMFQSFDPALIESMRRSSSGTYQEFKSRVIAARKYEPGSIDSVAEGRVFSAAAAKQNRLIDEIGDLQAAITKAAYMANLKTYSVSFLPKQATFWEALKETDLNHFKTRIQMLNDPSAQLENALKQIPASGEWQYLMPYKLD